MKHMKYVENNNNVKHMKYVENNYDVKHMKYVENNNNVKHMKYVENNYQELLDLFYSRKLNCKMFAMNYFEDETRVFSFVSR